MIDTGDLHVGPGRVSVDDGRSTKVQERDPRDKQLGELRHEEERKCNPPDLETEDLCI